MDSVRIESLEALIRSHGLASPELKTALTRLSGEIHSRLLRGTDSSIDFIEASVRALARLKGSSNAVVRMTCLCDSAQYLFSNGRSSEAVVAAAHCEYLARRTDNKDWLCKAHGFQAMAHAELGNVAQSVIQCNSALEIARETGNLIREAAILLNIGIALNYGGLYKEAIPHFGRAIELLSSPKGVEEASKLGPLGAEYERSALTNQAQSHYALGQFDQGYAVMDRCLTHSTEPWDATSRERRSIRELTFVQLALELGKLREAREHAKSCWHYGLGANQRAHFHSGLALALCEVHGGDVKQGIAHLERLLPEARLAAHRVTVLDCLIRAYEHSGQPELALERMNELLTHIRAQREASIAALMSMSTSLRSSKFLASKDLEAMTTREALLRTKVAERKVIVERIEMFERFAIAADLKEEESGKHGYRVARMAALMAQRLNWTKAQCAALEMTARLHDIGKMAVPDRILFSSQHLKDAERRLMTAHTTIGSELLSKSALPELRMAEEIARHHHEWWNGTGYPSKLSGKRIPIHARIVALADVFDALTHGRPYAPAWSVDKAIEEIRNRRGTQFDPDLTDTFLALIDDLRREHPDLDAFLAEASRNSPFLQARDKIRRMLEGERRAEKLAETAAETVH